MNVTGHEDAFWFLTVISNPMMYRSRPRLYVEFRRHVLEDLGANLLTVELALGERDTHVVEAGSASVPFPSAVNTPVQEERISDREVHVHVRSDSVLWHKENMINIGISRLPPSCRYVAWVDADLTFLNPNIVRDTVNQLQMYKVVQMFRNSLDMGPNGEVMQLHTSFGYCFTHRLTPPWSAASSAATGANGGGGKKKQAAAAAAAGVPYYAVDAVPPSREQAVGQAAINQVYWHPGYAWAARLDTLNALGGVLDIAIVGSGDHHMACCMVGRGSHSLPAGLHANYVGAVEAYQELCDKHVQRRLGYVDGTIKHGFHGFKAKRGYNSRWDILVRNRYDPLRDIKRNLHGIYELCRPDSDLAHDIMTYFRSRTEDICVEMD